MVTYVRSGGSSRLEEVFVRAMETGLLVKVWDSSRAMTGQALAPARALSDGARDIAARVDSGSACLGAAWLEGYDPGFWQLWQSVRSC